MFKASKYNNVFTEQDAIIVFNSLSGMILKSKNPSVKGFLLYNEQASSDTFLTQKLAKDGFIVPENIDEDALNYLLDFDAISSNELKLVILPTLRCNFRCSYCYQNFDSLDMTNEVMERIIHFVKNEIHNYSGLSIGWYGGEPLLAQATIDRLSQQFIGICHAANRKYSAAITTNGYLLTKNVFSSLLKNRVTLYQITLDGPEYMHNKDRKLANGDGTFDVIFQNLVNIKNSLPAGHFKIKIRSNMQEGKINEYHSFVDQLFGTFGLDKRFTYWFTAVSNYGGDAIKHMDNLLSTFDEIYDMLLAHRANLNYEGFYHQLSARSCIAAVRNSYVIMPDGSLRKCSAGLDDECNKIGQISEKGELDLDKFKLAKWLCYKRDPLSRCASREKGDVCTNFACPKVNNFPDSGIDCTENFINIEKIIKLLCRRHYNFIKEY